MGAGWLIAILAFGLLATGVGVAIRQSLVAQRQLEWLRADTKARLEELEASLRKFDCAVEAAAETARQLERALETLPEAALPRASINISRRAQLLRLYRQGERPEQIAAALGVPLNEVELAIKVHQIAMSA
jgi:DNA-directed RNA polymerase specialized sigma24 family protein